MNLPTNWWCSLLDLIYLTIASRPKQSCAIVHDHSRLQSFWFVYFKLTIAIVHDHNRPTIPIVSLENIQSRFIYYPMVGFMYHTLLEKHMLHRWYAHRSTDAVLWACVDRSLCVCPPTKSTFTYEHTVNKYFTDSQTTHFFNEPLRKPIHLALQKEFEASRTSRVEKN